jgi:polysaccharide biosynthesis/export protein
VKSGDERYRIGFQDTIEVTVYKHADFGGTFNVSPDGTIRLPRLDEPIVVVCKTERQLADEIAEKHKTILKNPFVNVRAVEQRSQSFAVIGAVEKPGSFFLNRRIRLLELLSFAGGPDSEKAGTKLIVARTGSSSVCRQKGEETLANTDNADLILYQYKIRDVLEGKENLWMQPGDIVSVLDFDLVYVYGNVNKQGSVKLKQPLTLRQAIVEAEGFKPASKKDKIRILRQKADNTEWEEFTFDLKEIDAGKVKDPLLMPNDIVAVSEDKTKSILNSVTKSITGGLPSLFYRVP